MATTKRGFKMSHVSALWLSKHIIDLKSREDVIYPSRSILTFFCFYQPSEGTWVARERCAFSWAGSEPVKWIPLPFLFLRLYLKIKVPLLTCRFGCPFAKNRVISDAVWESFLYVCLWGWKVRLSLLRLPITLQMSTNHWNVSEWGEWKIIIPAVESYFESE